jgi:hypothetical protein
VPIKGRTRALLERVGRAGTRTRQALSWGRSLFSPAWTLVTPYCKRTRPGRGTNTKAAGFPPLSRPSPATSLPPFALAHALDPSGLGHVAHSLVGLGTPRSRNADKYISCDSFLVVVRMHCECIRHLLMRHICDVYLIGDMKVRSGILFIG